MKVVFLPLSQRMLCFGFKVVLHHFILNSYYPFLDQSPLAILLPIFIHFTCLSESLYYSKNIWYSVKMSGNIIDLVLMVKNCLLVFIKYRSSFFLNHIYELTYMQDIAPCQNCEIQVGFVQTLMMMTMNAHSERIKRGINNLCCQSISLIHCT